MTVVNFNEIRGLMSFGLPCGTKPGPDPHHFDSL